LAEFFKSAIPEYAILSHTWEGEEVTFEELQNGTGTKNLSTLRRESGHVAFQLNSLSMVVVVCAQ